MRSRRRRSVIRATPPPISATPVSAMPVTATPVSGRSLPPPVPPDGEVVGDAESDGVGDSEADGDSDADGDSEGSGDSDADGDSDGSGDSETDGVGVGVGVGVGLGTVPLQVWLTLKSSPVPLIVADPSTSFHPAGVNR
ncbi:hypothetical protein ACIA59_33270 [Micromonospora haikouensis]|uniref:hypothetical protein n=2 Tax=Micromonosporaceae TaxID=28056 RepID=UPI00378D28F4